MNIEQIKKMIEESAGPIIEIAGPTPQGYEFIDKNNIRLLVAPIVTNITKEIILNPHGDNPSKYKVDAAVDIKQLPYDDSSVHIILTSNLPYWDTDKEQALAEYKFPGNPKHNLHLFLYKESARVLIEDGLLIQVNPTPEDIPAAKFYGLNSKYYKEGDDTTCVFMKFTQQLSPAAEMPTSNSSKNTKLTARPAR